MSIDRNNFSAKQVRESGEIDAPSISLDTVDHGQSDKDWNAQFDKLGIEE